MLRPHIKCAKGHWHEDDDRIAEPENLKCAVVMPSMEAGCPSSEYLRQKAA